MYTNSESVSMGERTTLSLNTKNRASLKTTVPMFIVKQWGLKAEYHIPLNYDKKGGKSYEIDGLNALNEGAFRELLRSRAEPYFDEDIYNRMLRQKEHTVKYINKLVSDKITFK